MDYYSMSELIVGAVSYDFLEEIFVFSLRGHTCKSVLLNKTVEIVFMLSVYKCEFINNCFLRAITNIEFRLWKHNKANLFS